MRRIAFALSVLLVVSAVALAGCQNAVNSALKSGVENATGVKTEGNSVTINNDGKQLTIGGSKEGALPDGFPTDFAMFSPITITGGAKAAANGETQFTVTGNATAGLTEAKTFYAEKLKAAGWTVEEQTTAGNGAGVASVNATKAADKANVQLIQSAPSKPVEFIVVLKTTP